MTKLNLLEAAYKQIEQNQEMVTADPYRLHYHMMPPVGLLNDPNGFVFYQGHYHMFYQWNPFATKHGAKFWGHYMSVDLVHWNSAPIALAPDQWYDKDGCYSGSAVVYGDKLYLFYTGNVKNEQGNREAYQCLAVSDNGVDFCKKGPIIHVPDGYTAHFRDPKVFYREGQWNMVIGAQNSQEQGEVVLYTSSDLENWKFRGAIAGSHKSELGEFGYMWECPDLFRLNDRDILVFSPQGLEPDGYKYNNIFQSGYLSGWVDYSNYHFNHDAFQEMDRGFDFYAPQTTDDSTGRRLLFGWMGNAEAEEGQHPTVKNNWIHALTLPRYLEWKGGKLLQHPVKELKLLRLNKVSHRNVQLKDQKADLDQIHGNVMELKIAIRESSAKTFSITLGESKLTYNQNTSTFSFQRRCFNKDEFESRHCHLNELRNIQLYKDTSSLEIFINQGEEVFTSRIFDKPGETKVIFQAEGQVTFDLDKWGLKKVFT